jgi:hypothetical protein
MKEVFREWAYPDDKTLMGGVLQVRSSGLNTAAAWQQLHVH